MPLPGLPSQSANPGAQTNVHCPDEQTADAFAGVAQVTPQPPQLRRSPAVLRHALAQQVCPMAHVAPPLQLGMGVHAPLLH